MTITRAADRLLRREPGARVLMAAAGAEADRGGEFKRQFGQRLYDEIVNTTFDGATGEVAFNPGEDVVLEGGGTKRQLRGDRLTGVVYTLQLYDGIDPRPKPVGIWTMGQPTANITLDTELLVWAAGAKPVEKLCVDEAGATWTPCVEPGGLARAEHLQVSLAVMFAVFGLILVGGAAGGCYCARQKKKHGLTEAREKEVQQYQRVREGTHSSHWLTYAHPPDVIHCSTCQESLEEGQYGKTELAKKGADKTCKRCEVKALRRRLSSQSLQDVRVDFCDESNESDDAGADESAAPVDGQPGSEQLQRTASSAGNYYSKFKAGFMGSFAGMQTFHAGLDGMIGECRKDVLLAMEEEHTKVVQGFGASTTEYSTGNYGISTCCRKEWDFVVNLTRDPAMEHESVLRESKDIHQLHRDAWELISASFAARGATDPVFAGVRIKRRQIDDIELRLEECIGMRLYTGPMFSLYNTVLRAFGNDAHPGFVPDYLSNFAGESVSNRFVTTVHCINSGILKLSRLQPACKMYRGVSGMLLPRCFLEPDQFNVRGGVEYGFMSCTTDVHVACEYASGGAVQARSVEGGAGIPKTIMVANMGMVDRGAALDWLSQYPEEREILLPPLTALEVLSSMDVRAQELLPGAPPEATVHVVEVRLNCNMLSLTLERLLAVRKKQVTELGKIIDVGLRDVQARPAAAATAGGG
eukprot:SAG22_NODE_1146_length_5374_cov_7.602654_3_plen_696_part_01